MSERIGFAVPAEIRKIWVDRIPREKKRVIKLALIEMIKKHADIKIDVKQEQSTTIYNVVMPSIEVKPIIQNTNKQEVQGVQGDPEVTKEYVKALEADIQRLKKVLKAKNEEIRQLKQRMQLIQKLARVGDIRSIRRVLGVSGA